MSEAKSYFEPVKPFPTGADDSINTALIERQLTDAFTKWTNSSHLLGQKGSREKHEYCP
jgi:hypothetical protein